ncbi:uncharacterized protein BO66DRAFT_430210 [Aspergillus aculeatinus CBS 121060]|uniref:Uncharacterized protein n=1 Tax=Aspergillus aculeatinus CBS 121060 TaxID=1448322 RepID=A0ACD1H3D5_9EURO|nr:hypothetical protein BO66DRAFT_430210 [Aspergillus aculeatinus CBS 121060]RAH67893.1 hypothetical protein BO66DRAFT_430210 [Aspergillus aculeatinus CBS 121060]
MANRTSVPPNDPQSPRWLLDLQQWRIVPYTDIPQRILDGEGYGVVSYTWGYIVDGGKPASDPPQGLLWDVPAVKGWTLAKARQVMETIGTRYIWWDWMHIYGKAKKSIVWLHATCWERDSAIKDLLHLRIPDDKPREDEDNQTPAELEEHTNSLMRLLKQAHETERWTCSGWTLQEGVLLHETELVDGCGQRLPDKHFWLSDQATVADLTVPITRLAWEIAIAYFIKSQGYEPDVGTPIPKRPHVFARLPELWLRRSLQTLTASGFVAYWQNSPLDILAGKRGRKFGKIQDSCWALVGALGIDNIEVTYAEDFGMDKVKRRLLVALFDKYTWGMLALPYPESIQDVHTGVERDFRWTDVADGAVLPVHAFCVEQKTAAPDPNHQELESLKPSYTETHNVCIHSCSPTKRITLFRASKEGMACFRHYRQDKDGLKIVSAEDTAFVDDSVLGKAWFLPLHHVNMKAGALGRRCLAVLGLGDKGSIGERAEAGFGVFPFLTGMRLSVGSCGTH